MTIIQCQVIYKVQITSSHQQCKVRKHADKVRLVRPGSAGSPERFIMNQTNLGFDMVGVGIYIYGYICKYIIETAK